VGKHQTRRKLTNMSRYSSFHDITNHQEENNIGRCYRTALHGRPACATAHISYAGSFQCVSIGVWWLPIFSVPTLHANKRVSSPHQKQPVNSQPHIFVHGEVLTWFLHYSLQPTSAFLTPLQKNQYTDDKTVCSVNN
jgi:hypothetical protein